MLNVWQMDSTRADEIRSVTSAWTAMSGTKVDQVDERLMKMLSTRSYEAVVMRAKMNAVKVYQDCFGDGLSELLTNHASVETILGTEGDQNGGWRIDPRDMSYESLLREITTLEKKLERVKSENNELESCNSEKLEKLRTVQEQNERLETIRDSQ